MSMRRASQDSWAAHHARLLIKMEQCLEDIDLAEADAKAASAAADATVAELHAQEQQQLQRQQRQMERLVQQMEEKVHQLEQDGSNKQQQQEELTSMCAQVSTVCLTHAFDGCIGCRHKDLYVCLHVPLCC
jgi:ABC-type xylose transport system substrate-binding protein